MVMMYSLMDGFFNFVNCVKDFCYSGLTLVHFLCLPLCPLGCLCPVFKGAKKTNQQQSGERKGSQSLAVSLLIRLWRISLCLCPLRVLLAKRRALRNSLRLYPLAGCSDSPRAIPSFAALLGCVKWHSKSFSLFLKFPFCFLSVPSAFDL